MRIPADSPASDPGRRPGSEGAERSQEQEPQSVGRWSVCRKAREAGEPASQELTGPGELSKSRLPRSTPLELGLFARRNSPSTFIDMSGFSVWLTKDGLR